MSDSRPVSSSSGRSIRILVDYVASRGVDADAFAREFGLQLAQLDDPSCWIPVSISDRMWQRAEQLCDDPNIGIHVARSAMHGAGGLLSYLASYSADYRAALERWIRFLPTAASVTRFRLEETPERARILCDTGRPCAGRQGEEWFMAIPAHFGRDMCGPQFRIEHASFRSGPPPDLREHHALFGSDITFHGDALYIDLAPSMLSLPVRSRDDELAQLLEVAATNLRAAQTGGDLGTRVRLHIAELLACGSRAQAEEVAARLQMSPRTLRRRLSDAGVSYRALHDQVLADMADGLLRDPDLGIDEVRRRLRFADMRTLSNATRRWFGMTPQQYRRRHSPQRAPRGHAPQP